MVTARRLALLLAVSPFVAAGCQGPVVGTAGYADRDQSEAMIAVCRTQESAWNRGDIEGFMREGYLRSPDLTFYSGGDVTLGYDTVLERYRKSYQGEGKEMGRLVFSDLDTLLLGSGAGIVRGRWRLDFAEKESVGGLFTLVMRRTADGWRIVHDHTSVAAPR